MTIIQRRKKRTKNKNYGSGRKKVKLTKQEDCYFMPEIQSNINEGASSVEDTNLMAFKTYLRNVNWN